MGAWAQWVKATSLEGYLHIHSPDGVVGHKVPPIDPLCLEGEVIGLRCFGELSLDVELTCAFLSREIPLVVSTANSDIAREE